VGSGVSRKIFFINRFYRPDHSATSQILTDLTRHLEPAGSEIHVITSRLLYDDSERLLPAYERLDGVHVHRVWSSRFGRGKLLGRAVDYLSFYATSLLTMLRSVGRGDILVAKTDPPLISVFAALACKLKGASLINWLQDLFPEVAAELGIRGLSSGPLYRLARGLRNWSLRTARANVVLGEGMARRIENEIAQAEKTRVIPNWVIGSDMRPIAREENPLLEEWGLGERFVIGYSGNLGRAHDYKTILEAAICLQDEPSILFLFIGGGAGYQLLREEMEKRSLPNVLFKPYQPADRLAYSLSLADVHLISLEPRLEGLIVPSKLYGILAVGRPMIFLGDRQGEIGGLIEDHELGCVAAMGEPNALIQSIESLSRDHESCGRMGGHARRLFEQRYAPDISYRSWRELLVERANTRMN